MGRSHLDVLGYWKLEFAPPSASGAKVTHSCLLSQLKPQLLGRMHRLKYDTGLTASSTKILSASFKKKKVRFMFIAQRRKKATSPKDNFVVLRGQPGQMLLRSPNSMYSVTNPPLPWSLRAVTNTSLFLDFLSIASLNVTSQCSYIPALLQGDF